jgi:hypothetical protein
MASPGQEQETAAGNGVTGDGCRHINPVTPFSFGELRSRLLFLVRILMASRKFLNHLLHKGGGLAYNQVYD